MIGNNESIWCEGCGVEVTWGPVVVEERYYCCQDCATGIPCDCGIRMEISDDLETSNTLFIDHRKP